MIDDKVRKMFECWYREESLTSVDFLEFSGGHYLNTWVNKNWEYYKRGRSDIMKDHKYNQSQEHDGCVICGFRLGCGAHCEAD